MNFIMKCLIVIFIWLASNNQVRAQCEGEVKTITAKEIPGKITSPGYHNDGYNSGQLQRNTICRWHIESDDNLRLLIQVPFKDIDCAGDDMLTVYEGSDDVNGRNLNLVSCGEGTKSQLKLVRSGSVFVVFTTDETRNDKGFQLNFLGAPLIFDNACWSLQRLTAKESPQYISSPDFPATYPGDSSCSWGISSLNDCLDVQVEVLFMDIEHGEDCEFDQLVFTTMEGKSQSYCREHDWKPNIKSTSQLFKIDFNSDAVHERRGFLLKYSTVLADRCTNHISKKPLSSSQRHLTETVPVSQKTVSTQTTTKQPIKSATGLPPSIHSDTETPSLIVSPLEVTTSTISSKEITLSIISSPSSVFYSRESISSSIVSVSQKDTSSNISTKNVALSYVSSHEVAKSSISKHGVTQSTIVTSSTIGAKGLTLSQVKSLTMDSHEFISSTIYSNTVTTSFYTFQEVVSSTLGLHEVVPSVISAQKNISSALNSPIITQSALGLLEVFPSTILSQKISLPTSSLQKMTKSTTSSHVVDQPFISLKELIQTTIALFPQSLFGSDEVSQSIIGSQRGISSTINFHEVTPSIINLHGIDSSVIVNMKMTSSAVTTQELNQFTSGSNELIQAIINSLEGVSSTFKSQEITSSTISFQQILPSTTSYNISSPLFIGPHGRLASNVDLSHVGSVIFDSSMDLSFTIGSQEVTSPIFSSIYVNAWDTKSQERVLSSITSSEVNPSIVRSQENSSSIIGSMQMNLFTKPVDKSTSDLNEVTKSAITMTKSLTQPIFNLNTSLKSTNTSILPSKTLKHLNDTSMETSKRENSIYTLTTSLSEEKPLLAFLPDSSESYANNLQNLVSSPIITTSTNLMKPTTSFFRYPYETEYQNATEGLMLEDVSSSNLAVKLGSNLNVNMTSYHESSMEMFASTESKLEYLDNTDGRVYLASLEASENEQSLLKQYKNTTPHSSYIYTTNITVESSQAQFQSSVESTNMNQETNKVHSSNENFISRSHLSSTESVDGYPSKTTNNMNQITKATHSVITLGMISSLSTVTSVEPVVELTEARQNMAQSITLTEIVLTKYSKNISKTFQINTISNNIETENISPISIWDFKSTLSSKTNQFSTYLTDNEQVSMSVQPSTTLQPLFTFNTIIFYGDEEIQLTPSFITVLTEDKTKSKVYSTQDLEKVGTLSLSKQQANLYNSLPFATAQNKTLLSAQLDTNLSKGYNKSIWTNSKATPPLKSQLATTTVMHVDDQTFDTSTSSSNQIVLSPSFIIPSSFTTSVLEHKMITKSKGSNKVPTFSFIKDDTNVTLPLSSSISLSRISKDELVSKTTNELAITLTKILKRTQSSPVLETVSKMATGESLTKTQAVMSINPAKSLSETKSNLVIETFSEMPTAKPITNSIALMSIYPSKSYKLKKISEVIETVSNMSTNKHFTKTKAVMSINPAKSISGIKTSPINETLSRMSTDDSIANTVVVTSVNPTKSFQRTGSVVETVSTFPLDKPFTNKISVTSLYPTQSYGNRILSSVIYSLSRMLTSEHTTKHVISINPTKTINYIVNNATYLTGAVKAENELVKTTKSQNMMKTLLASNTNLETNTLIEVPGIKTSFAIYESMTKGEQSKRAPPKTSRPLTAIVNQMSTPQKSSYKNSRLLVSSMIRKNNATPSLLTSPAVESKTQNVEGKENNAFDYLNIKHKNDLKNTKLNDQHKNEQSTYKKPAPIPNNTQNSNRKFTMATQLPTELSGDDKSFSKGRNSSSLFGLLMQSLEQNGDSASDNYIDDILIKSSNSKQNMSFTFGNPLQMYIKNDKVHVAETQSNKTNLTRRTLQYPNTSDDFHVPVNTINITISRGNNTNLSTGEKAGIVAGVLSGFILLAAIPGGIVYCMLKNSKRQKRNKKPHRHKNRLKSNSLIFSEFNNIKTPRWVTMLYSKTFTSEYNPYFMNSVNIVDTSTKSTLSEGTLFHTDSSIITLFPKDIKVLDSDIDMDMFEYEEK